MEFSKVLKNLNEFASIKNAEKWDNVGLLVEPSKCGPVRNILLTNDLTTSVLKEALQKDVQCIVSYHPPLFSSFKRLSQADVKQRIAIRCIENQIAVFSHHTAIDAKKGGVNDWLVAGLGQVKSSEPLVQSEALNSSESMKLISFVPFNDVDNVRQAMAKAGAGQIGEYSECSFTTEGTGSFKGSKESNPTVGEAGKFETVQEKKLEMVCSKRNLPKIVKALQETHPYEEVAYELYNLSSKPIDGVGMGRLAKLEQAISLKALIENLKKHLEIPTLRVAIASKHLHKSTEDIQIRSVGVCAGSGASLLRGTKCDLWLTGEASHHEVLAAVESGSCVILAEHSNTERGYIRQVMSQELQAMLGDQITVLVSQVDADPLVVH